MQHMSPLQRDPRAAELAASPQTGRMSGLPGYLLGQLRDRKLRRLGGTIVLAAWLGGCAITAPVNTSRFDFGDPGHALANQAHGPVVVPDVTAPSDLDSDQIRYRLGYLDDQQTRGYATSRWTMTPAQLMTQRLRARLAGQGPVLTNPAGGAAPVLRVELTQFEQVFDQPTVGRGVVNLRATLTHRGRLLAQRDFFASVVSPSPDATGGAHALAQASDAAIAALLVWVDEQPQQ